MLRGNLKEGGVAPGSANGVCDLPVSSPDVFDDADGLLRAWPSELADRMWWDRLELHPSSTIALSMPCARIDTPCDYVHIYTDGSAGRVNGTVVSSWAFVIFASPFEDPAPDQVNQLGHYGDFVIEDPLDNQWIGAVQHDSRTGEASALLWAALWAHQHRDARRYIVHSDALSVLHCATGQWDFELSDPLFLRLRAVFHLVTSSFEDAAFGVRFVKAHAGHFGNELVDVTAGSIRQGLRTAKPPPIHYASWFQGTMPAILYAWMQVDADARHGEVPQFSSGRLSWTTPLPTPAPFTWLHLPEVVEGVASTCQLVLHLASYNVCTLREINKVLYLKQQAEYAQVHLLGLQETRTPHSSVFESGYVLIIAPADAGVGGCELWLSSTLPYASRGEERFFFRREHCTVLHVECQLLFVRVEAPFLNLLVVVGHAPHRHCDASVIDFWWQQVFQHILDLQGDSLLCLLLDANASVAPLAPIIGDAGLQTGDRSGAGFTRVLERGQAWLPSTFADRHWGQHATWASFKSGVATSRNDYVALPLLWRDHFVQSWVNLLLDAGLSLCVDLSRVLVVTLTDTIAREPAHRALQLLKPFRLGRRVRDLGVRTLPIVQDEAGQVCVDHASSMDRWRRHYAALEAGAVADPDTFVLLQDANTRVVPSDFKLEDVPSIFELERQFRLNKPGKGLVDLRMLFGLYL
eukprot:s119_g83.t1